MCIASEPVVPQTIDILKSTLSFAADNIDHNTITLDGKGTFHGMEIIDALIPAQKANRMISRHNISQPNITEKSRIEIEQLRFSNKARGDILFQDLPKCLDFDDNIDTLWEILFNF